MSGQVNEGKKSGRVSRLTKVAKVRMGRQSMEMGGQGTQQMAKAANAGR
jgi:hypothetical protein